MVAAQRTVEDKRFQTHSIHSYFLRAGNDNLPIIYFVDRVRDGKVPSVREVKMQLCGA